MKADLGAELGTQGQGAGLRAGVLGPRAAPDAWREAGKDGVFLGGHPGLSPSVSSEPSQLFPAPPLTPGDLALPSQGAGYGDLASHPEQHRSNQIT